VIRGKSSSVIRGKSGLDQAVSGLAQLISTRVHVDFGAGDATVAKKLLHHAKVARMSQSGAEGVAERVRSRRDVEASSLAQISHDTLDGTHVQSAVEAILEERRIGGGIEAALAVEVQKHRYGMPSNGIHRNTAAVMTFAHCSPHEHGGPRHAIVGYIGDV